MQPVFVFSLPRSGSTLLQRVLATHPEISTTSESWLLLPFITMLNGNDIYTSYYHSQAVGGIEDFCNTLPRGRSDFDKIFCDFVKRLYSKAADLDSVYFLDKTPRYHLIAEQIIELFDDAKFIFLWRNPLSIVASMIQTWGDGYWNLYRSKVDIYEGLECLIEAFETHREHVFSTTYESLVTSTDAWRDIFEYLNLSFDQNLLNDFVNVNLRGRWGDPTGVKKYQEISGVSLDKWKGVLSNPLRKCWARRYLRWIGRKRLARMGYDLDRLLTDVGEARDSLQYLLSDVIRMPYGSLRAWIEPRLLIDKFKHLPNTRYIVEHK